MADLLELQTQTGTFNFDACASELNAVCAEFCSIERPFQTVSSLAGRHCWINAPFSMLTAILQHYLLLKALSPENVTACILVPRWPGAPWGTLLTGMQRVKSYPEGYPLFEQKNSDGTSKVMSGIPWPVDVYWDKAYAPHKLAGLTGLEPLTMTFKGVVSGAPGTVAMDSQASHCFINKAFVQSHGIIRTPVHRMVELADGSHTQLQAECQVYLRIPSVKRGVHYVRKVRCYEVDMGSNFDLILGDDWLKHEKVDLLYSTSECVLHRSGLHLRPICKQRATAGRPDQPEPQHPATEADPLQSDGEDEAHQDGPQRRPPVLLSAIEARRLLHRAVCKRQPLKWFMVNVVDDGVAPHVKAPVPGQQADGTGPPDEEAEKQKILQSIPAHVSPGVRGVLEKYWHRFAARKGLPPDRGIAHLIPEEPGSRPVYRPPYRLSPLEIAEVERQVKELLLLGLIEPSNSPYGAPILFVGKKDGSLRMCCDWRRLNSQTIKSRYPLPRIDHLLDQLFGSALFTALDLTAGYHQILINPEDVPKTAFTTPFGHYQFKVMSFGLCNAPATFQQVMNKVFAPLLGKGVLVYMDDILIHAANSDEHCALLEQVMVILTEHDFYCRLPKCEFEQKELQYLGHIVGAEGVKVNPAKTRVVEQWPTPRSVREVRSFLGLANYFRRFVQGFALLTAPLVRLTRKGLVWHPDTWDDKCQKSFDGVKHALTHAPVLALPDFSRPMEVICDASLTGVGAVLMQDGNPLAYESKRLDDAQVKWTTTEQELWAVYHALTLWRCYLEGVKFTVVTDHNPLVHLPTQPNLSRKQARWVEYLQRFDFRWEYRPGRINVADPLSRVFEEAAQNLPLETGQNPLQLNALTLAVMTRSRKQPPPPPQNPPKPAKRKRGQTAGPSVDSPLLGATGGSAGASPGRDPDSLVVGVTTDAPLPGPLVGSTEDDRMLTLMQSGYASDPWFAEAANTQPLTHRDGLWWFGHRVVVPDAAGLRQGILYELHDAPYSGHPGVSKTLKAVQAMYWWATWRKDVENYVLACPSCQRNKASNQKPGGLLMPLPIPQQLWDSVSMDFISQLPRTPARENCKQGYDAILVFVDRLSKMVHLVPTFTTVTAIGTARLFASAVFARHGLPKDIVTDRGSVFTGKFMTELLRLLGTKHNRSTAFHPQSDGQTERVNRVLEDMLRHYVGDLRHSNWDECLPAAEFAINNAFHESIGTTPFRLVYGRDPRLPLSIPSTSKVPSAAQFADQMSQGLMAAKRCMQAAQKRQKAYYDAGRRHVEFQEGEEVLLSTKNIQLKRSGDVSSTPKLMPKWVGPFKVTAVVGNGAYKLALPSTLQIHDVFHVSLIKPYRNDGRVQPPAPTIVAGEKWYDVDHVLAHRERKRGKGMSREYLVSWKGYGSEHNSWEPEGSVKELHAWRDYWESLGLEPPV